MSPEVRHTFLVLEGAWEAEGVYYDADGTSFPHQGRTVIIHEKNVWISEGYMRIKAAPALEFKNRYEIAPLQPGNDYTTWKSYNPDLETLIGRYVIVEDSIISPWQSESGVYWGTEYLVQVTEHLYRGKGYAFHRNHKLSSWSVNLTYSEE